ncbi:MAG TPA: hypothetical protein VMV92_22210 [Streptosporangiaceae bacterium]|nr:hypothetical protein [Streptosporangiaceae bacterium]
MDDPRLRLLGTAEAGEAGRFLAALDAVRPIVTISPGLPPTAAGAALTLVALLCRVFPHVQVDGTRPTGPNPWGITDAADAVSRFRGACPVPTASPSRDVRVVLGAWAGPPARCPVLGVGGGDWTARLAWEPQPVDHPSIGLRHGLGIHAAACQATSELLKTVLAPLGMRALPLPGADGTSCGESLVWNLIDYRRTPAPLAEGTTGAVGRLRVVLAGAGSVGTSVAGMLAFFPELDGRASVVDPEDFDPVRNPFRYPALTGGETGPKATWTARLLRNAGWRAEPSISDIGSWNAGQPTPGIDGIVVSSVDDLAGRFDVADVLAREVISAGVSGLALHVQRECLGDGWACPYCEYVPAEPTLTQAHVIASLVGLTIERIIALQLPSAVLTAADLASCVASGKISPGAADRLAGHRLADLVAGAYAEAAIGSPGGHAAPGATGTVAVAAPQVSWLTGVIAAAELIKTASGLPVLERRVDIDLSGLPTGFTRRVKADTSGRCACASRVRRRWMVDLYGGRR